ncbi:MAG: hypothetical protein ACH346_05580 [Chthoniobacterales bacterium]
MNSISSGHDNPSYAGYDLSGNPPSPAQVKSSNEDVPSNNILQQIAKSASDYENLDVFETEVGAIAHAGGTVNTSETSETPESPDPTSVKIAALVKKYNEPRIPAPILAQIHDDNKNPMDPSGPKGPGSSPNFSEDPLIETGLPGDLGIGGGVPDDVFGIGRTNLGVGGGLGFTDLGIGGGVIDHLPSNHEQKKENLSEKKALAEDIQTLTRGMGRPGDIRGLKDDVRAKKHEIHKEVDQSDRETKTEKEEAARDIVTTVRKDTLENKLNKFPEIIDEFEEALDAFLFDKWGGPRFLESPPLEDVLVNIRQLADQVEMRSIDGIKMEMKQLLTSLKALVENLSDLVKEAASNNEIAKDMAQQQIQNKKEELKENSILA